MQEPEIKDEIIRRFLLGALPEAERARLEDAFLSDGQIFAQIADAENDLVDDYVAGRLGHREMELFNSYYLASRENRSKVDAARFLRHELQSEGTEAANIAVADARAEIPIGLWQSVRNAFSSRALVPAAVFAVLLCSVGIVWLVLRSPSNGEIAYSPAPSTNSIQPASEAEARNNALAIPNQGAAENSATVQQNSNAAPSDTPRANDRNVNLQPIPKRTPRPSQSTVTLALATGVVRGESEANRLVVPRDAARVRLTFDLPGPRALRDVEVRIETVAGARVWSGKINGTGGRVALNLPARIFVNEDYLLFASGTDEAGIRKDFAQFYFNCERK